MSLSSLKEAQWIKLNSKTYNRDYWFNEADGTTSWELPDEVSAKKRKVEPESPLSSNGNINPLINKPSIDIAIIVPFRDVLDQKRTQELNEFLPKMNNFLSKTSKTFRIYIIEQSDDERKFNRGKLLNIGFDLARLDGCSIFVFHDVDLLPSDELLKHYSTVPVDNPVHIARMWDRYNKNKSYFGGIVSFSREMFERINGFPNNFWGWGGEDDEMYTRTKECGYEPSSPSKGSITDLEGMDLDDKLRFLRTHQLKCMNKTEVLAEHAGTWRTNGLRINAQGETLRYRVVSEQTAAELHCRRVLVDVGLNDHWTDARSGILDNQLVATRT